jgi:type IV secretory pathway component VirB8
LIPNNFQSENNTLPVPTKDRGFYFKNSSEIRNSKSNIFSPDFTIRMTVKVTSDGVIMKSETNGTENFKLFVNNSEICFSVLMSQVVDSATLKYSENMTRVLRGKFIENRGNYDDYRGNERVRDGEKEKLNIEKNQNWKKFKEDEDYENLIVKNKDGKKVRILGSLVEDLEFKENKKRILSNESFSNENNSSQTVLGC